MLRLGEFEVLCPRTLEEALGLLREHERSLVVAGGTDLVPKLKRGQFEPPLLVSLSRLEGLDYVRTESTYLRIGSRTVLRALEEDATVRAVSVLHQATRSVATPIIRHSATVGGNLFQDTRCRFYDRGPFWREAIGYCMKKGADECRVAPGSNRCFASFCSDLAPALAVLDAEVTLVGERSRTIPIEELYDDDGMAHVRSDGEILVEVAVPQKGYRSTYRKLRLRESFDFPEAGVAAAVVERGGRLHVGVAVSAVASSMFVLKGDFARDEIPDLVERVYGSLKPMDTLSFPPAYRKKAARNLLRQAFDELLAA